MKTKPILFFLFTLLFGNLIVVHGATLPHQGRVLISGKAFEGTGSFRFALVDTAGNLVWNHQGTTGEPTTDLTLDIKGGFYSIALGDPSVSGMADLPASLFTSYAGLKLRIWFNDGTNGLQQLGTDQSLLVAPYALSADTGSTQRIASLEASLTQALSRIATLEQPPNTGGSSSIQNYSTTRTYPRGALVILGQDSFIATTNVPAGASPPNSTYWTNLSVAATALNVPVDTIPTLSAETILNSLPGTSPGGPSQPGPSLPGEVAATSRSYIFVDGSAQYQEVTLPPAAQNVGKEFIIHSKIGEVFVKGNKGEIESKDYAIITNWDQHGGSVVDRSNSKSFVSDGKQWKLVGGRRNQFHTIPSSSGGFDIAFGSGAFVDVAKGAIGSSPRDFAVLGNHLYFSANDGINGTELWKTDGTVTGTMMVKDLIPGATGSNPTGLTVFNNALYFAATDANGTELWKSDGTANGTVLFKDFVPGAGSGSPTNIRVDGNQLRFNAAQESWNSDGTLAGTVVQGPSFTDNPYAKLGNWYYFAGNDSNGTELWRSDALSYSGQLFKDLWSGSSSDPSGFGNVTNSSSPSGFVVFGNAIYFSATNANGNELWKTDGTLAGTVMIKDVYPGSFSHTFGSSPNSSNPSNFSIIDNILYFTATDANGTSGWKTDGTAIGTVKVPGLEAMNGEPVKFGNALYYQGQDVLGAELHKVDLNGSATSSSMFGSVNDLGNNWKQSTWFGTYLDTSTNWIFHDALGWIYPVDSSGNENWLYHATLGWMWTNQSVYPFLYLNSGSEWIYLSNQAYYSYSSNSSINWGGGPSAPIEDYSASKSYTIGSLARVGQDSFMAIQAVPAGTSPPNTAYWTNLSVVANAWSIPVEDVPSLSPETILASLPGSAPNTGGPSAPTGATHLVDLNSTVNLQMIRVEPGTFTMGDLDPEVMVPEHNVTLTKGFYLGKYEVTQAEYEAVMTGNPNGLSATPSQSSGNPNRPVENVSWDDIQVFLTRLNAQQAANLPAGWSYVLPTESQWEYACRAGTTTAYSWGATTASSNANYDWDGTHNTGIDFKRTRDVGQYAANPWGFFDMHGNIAEWCADWYVWRSSTSYVEPLTDPTGPASGLDRVTRGGSWSEQMGIMRSAVRYHAYSPSHWGDFLGFRLAFKQQ
jgi:ELWxxDGT repeat protein